MRLIFLFMIIVTTGACADMECVVGTIVPNVTDTVSSTSTASVGGGALCDSSWVQFCNLMVTMQNSDGETIPPHSYIIEWVITPMPDSSGKWDNTSFVKYAPASYPTFNGYMLGNSLTSGAPNEIKFSYRISDSNLPAGTYKLTFSLESNPSDAHSITISPSYVSSVVASWAVPSTFQGSLTPDTTVFIGELGIPSNANGAVRLINGSNPSNGLTLRMAEQPLSSEWRTVTSSSPSLERALSLHAATFATPGVQTWLLEAKLECP